MCYAQKIEKHEGKIDFNNNIEQIDLLIRALGDIISVYFEHNGERIRVLKANFERQQCDGYQNGDIVDTKTLSIKCNDGIMKPLILQREGKKQLPIEEFVRGFR